MTEKKANRFKEKAETDLEESEVKEVIGEKIKERKKISPPTPPLPSGSTGKLKAFFQNEKLHKLTGLALLLSSVYLLIAFVSFFFNSKNGLLASQVDQDKTLRFLEWASDTSSHAENWLGKTGALLSHYFINNSFGFASFIFPFLLFIVGFRVLFGITLCSISKSLKYSFFLLIWTSLASAYFLPASFLFFAGKYGVLLNLWLNTLIGSAGVFCLIIFSFLGFSVIAFNLSFNWFKKSEQTETFSTEENNLVDEPAEENIAPIQSVRKRKPEVNNVIKDEPVSLQDDSKDSVINNSQDLELTVNENTIREDKKVEEIAIESPVEPVSISDVKFEVEKVIETEELNPEAIIDPVAAFGEYDPTLDLSSYQFPTIDLLEKHGSDTITVNNEELQANKNRILETLANYNIQIEKIKATIGPTVTLYEIVPAAGVRISKIKNLEDDIALSLSALGIRIIAPIPGKGTIGIEVPNQKAEVVSMRSILGSEKFQNTTMDLPIGLGKTISNETFIADLTKMPHLLMAGATGQGKSVGLNAILVSLLYKKHPSQVKFVLVDPKKVELTLFNTIERHFLAKLPDSAEAIITDTKKVIHTLNSLCIEMDNRYELLKNAQVRNLKEYNAKFISRKLNPNDGHHFLPYIVLVVDEFADLIMTAGKEVEAPIARLAQLARAIGIHLIIATQRPSVNIITGTIKANFPARIAFRVTSKIDSRTILDSGGADQLIGRGDMLLSTGNDLIRIQCAFVDTPEVEKITDFIGSQRGYADAFLLPEYIDETSTGSETLDPGDRDQNFEEAARIIVQHQQGSASLLQRRLKLGYNRAGRIIDQLEAAGIIGPFEGSKAREVLIKDPASLEQFLTKRD